MATHSLRVLVVDDSEDAAGTLALLLNMSGHQTRTANDGPQALVVARDFVPDAVLLDIGLPGLSGHQVARHLRSEPDGNALLLIALTGWGEDTESQTSIDAGFDVHLVKPVNFDHLLALLANHRRADADADCPAAAAAVSVPTADDDGATD